MDARPLQAMLVHLTVPQSFPAPAKRRAGIYIFTGGALKAPRP